MCYETLRVKDADDRADGRMEQSGESQACNDSAISVSVLEATVVQAWVSTGDTDCQDAIGELLQSAKKPEIIIGVIRATGAGKSSLINAIIDEEGMLATNCMHAATAVATEIAYNDGPQRYKAEVQF